MMQMRFTVCDGGRKCCQYFSESKAIAHANSIKGKVKYLPYSPQYTKERKLRGGQVKLATYGIRQSACSQDAAKLGL
jgi:hypothetical protein